MKRRFSIAEKRLLYVLAEGKCVLCGQELAANWHGDHIVPFAAGGETALVNGQALCPKCNLTKGADVFNLRGWQKTGLERFQYLSTQKSEILCVATPGSGKTIFALNCFKWLRNEGRVHRLVVVVPTDNLREQWANAAHGLGIELDPRWKAGAKESADFCGVVVTYQSINFAKVVHDYICTRYGTMVIFDEVHHIGEDLVWGDAMKAAFEHSWLRLSLSGTPFRSDSILIPFIEYQRQDDRSLISKADIEYTYVQAIRDQVCRRVAIPLFDGDVKWLSKYGDVQEAKLSDVDIAEEYKSERNRVVLEADGNWLREVIVKANEQITKLRALGQYDAGGLVLAINQHHARSIQEQMKAILGEEPAIAISEDPEGARQAIDSFRAGTKRWIVAVRMISEGVDIRRLRVLVYATNITCRLFFLQAIGRVLRTTGEDDQWAYVFIPQNEKLVKFAQEIYDTVNAHLINELEPDDIDGPTGVEGCGTSGPRFPSAASLLNSSAEHTGTFMQEAFVGPADLDDPYVVNMANQFGITREVAARMIVGLGLRKTSNGTTACVEDPPEVPEAAKFKQADLLKLHIKKLAGKIMHKYGQGRLSPQPLHLAWLALGNKTQALASVVELENKLGWLQDILTGRIACPRLD